MAVSCPYIFLRREPCGISRKIGMSDALARSLWRDLVFKILLRDNFGHIPLFPVGVDGHTIHYHLLQAQVAEDSRRAIGQFYNIY